MKDGEKEIAATEVVLPRKEKKCENGGGMRSQLQNLSSWGIQKFVACPHTYLENIWCALPLRDSWFFSEGEGLGLFS